MRLSFPNIANIIVHRRQQLLNNSLNPLQAQISKFIPNEHTNMKTTTLVRGRQQAARCRLELEMKRRLSEGSRRFHNNGEGPYADTKVIKQANQPADSI